LRWSSDCSWSIDDLGTALPDGDRQPVVRERIGTALMQPMIPRRKKSSQPHRSSP
jgi:hypothetical protein